MSYKIGLISVIIPVYNTEKHLEKCMDSVVNQTYSNLEIICVNDGSTDGSLEILKKHAEKDSRINILDKPNTGVSNSRNKALKIATGEFITFCDSDDYVDLHYCEELINAVETAKTDIAMCKFRVVYDDTKNIEYVAEKKNIILPINKIGREYTGASWGFIYRHSIIENIRFNENLSLGEDTEFSLEVLFTNKKPLAVIDKDLYFYYNRKSSATHNISGLEFRRHRVEGFIDLYKRIKSGYVGLYIIKDFNYIRYHGKDKTENERLKREVKYYKKSSLLDESLTFNIKFEIGVFSNFIIYRFMAFLMKIVLLLRN